MKALLVLLKILCIAVLALFGVLCVGAGACFGILSLSGQWNIIGFAIIAGFLAVGCIAAITMLVRSLTTKDADDDFDPKP
jgi:membrane protein implicated in regulation of membrane protease activity